jgi:hypothetical protein
MPLFKIYHEEYRGDDPKEIEASSHWIAAMEYAEYYNTYSGDLPLLNNNDSIEVIVENEEGEKISFNISAEPDIRYSAVEVGRK